jgi:hypothetical protein
MLSVKTDLKCIFCGFGEIGPMHKGTTRPTLHIGTYRVRLSSWRDFFDRPFCGEKQGCQMVCFQTQNPNLGKFWKVLVRKILVYFRTIWSILWPFGIFRGNLVYFSPFLVFWTKKNLATLLKSHLNVMGLI